MRLSKYEQNSIKKHFKNIFPNAKLYLFGSRVDDSKKGGDIDLYIETLSDEYSYPKLLSFNSFIQADIGEQKIDIVVNKIDKQIDKLIYTNAKNKGYYLDELELKLQNAIAEEEKHFKRFFSACKKLEVSAPFDEKLIETLNEIYKRKDDLFQIYSNLKSYVKV
jgi:hypothetical protein